MQVCFGLMYQVEERWIDSIQNWNRPHIYISDAGVSAQLERFHVGLIRNPIIATPLYTYICNGATALHAPSPVNLRLASRSKSAGGKDVSEHGNPEERKKTGAWSIDLRS